MQTKVIKTPHQTAVYYMGKRIDANRSWGAWVRYQLGRLIYWTKVSTVLALIAAGLMGAGALIFSTSTVTADTATVVINANSPVLARIADCESGNGKPGTGTQFKNGQVIMRANTNGTIDIGKYQVNLTYWGKQATALGYDLTKEADNKAMAEWIYQNKGTGDWSSSQHCWAK